MGSRSRQVISKGLQRGGLRPVDLAAVGITNQRETAVVWERATGKPIHNAIVWQDTRTADLCNELAAEGGPDRFRKQTGLPLATYFAGPKAAWLLDNVAGARARAAGRRVVVWHDRQLARVELDRRDRPVGGMSPM